MPTQTAEQFVEELTSRVRETIARLGERSASADLREGVSIPMLLQGALKNELEASEEAALWMTRESDLDVKLALARQCGDEAKHYRLIAERLAELGAGPLPQTAGAGLNEASPLFRYLAELPSTVERVAAGQFTREALAEVRNEIFAAHCERMGDLITAKLYREVIGPDEAHHHALGRRLLLKFATTAEAQEKARAASERTLEIAGAMQDAAFAQRGVARAPGC